MKPHGKGMKAQSGLAMLALVAVLTMGSLWWLMKGLSQPINHTAAHRAHNAKVLHETKAALIGYVAAKAATPGENDPGSLPCPEAAGFIGNPNDEGKAASNCSLPAIGRLPWRTLGIPKPLDAAGEPLWYVVSPGWAKPNSTTNTIINSNTAGQLSVDGVESVAVIIAPGQRLQVATSANCIARNQSRNVPSPTMDFRDYLECQNATPADLVFASNDAVGPFNDQVLAVTTAEIMPAIEAAAASRFERELAPLIRSAYSSSDPNHPNPAWPATKAVLPFAAQFENPTGADFRGEVGRYRGLLPFVRSQTACTCVPAGNCECTPTACTGGGKDCDPGFVRWTGATDPTMSGPDVHNADCDRSDFQIDCVFYLRVPLLGGPPSSVAFTVNGMRARHVGRSLKQFQPEAPMPGVLPAGRTLTGTLNADSTATITLSGFADTSDAGGGGLVGNLLCGISGLLALTLGCAQDSIRIPYTVLVDHPILDRNHPQYGWFHRNMWHHVSFFAIAGEIAPDGSGICTSPFTGASSDCLTVKFTVANDTHRGLLLIAGRRLPGQNARPNGDFSHWFEGDNGNDSNGRIYTVREPIGISPDYIPLTVNRTFNDRVAVIDKN
jgi:hypothetical protein